ncbi:hypothetical protein B484DRAFT_416735, partial [Ochromonadaceae sp. CCMP2298]
MDFGASSLQTTSVATEFTEHEETRKKYTQEENYRAYKLFSMMDVDGGGSISLREIYRVLMGDAERFVSCDFDHPDTGIIWGLDDENCVIITEIEAGSQAASYPFLTSRMRIQSINDEVIARGNPVSLEKVYQLLLRLHDDAVTLEFEEPIIVVNRFSCILDLEVNNKLYAVTLPIGAVYNLDSFKRRLSEDMARMDPLLKHLHVDFYPRQRQIYFHSKKFQFRFLFHSGRNNRRSCRYALGFNAEDLPYAAYHTGQPMLIDLDLGLDRQKTEILFNELFSKFDRDNSGEFEFEEFRDFYIKYLDTDERIAYLKKFANHRFRDIELERRAKILTLERENKLRRRAYLKVKHADLLVVQRNAFLDNSIVDNHGNRRRMYKHRPAPEGKSTKEAVKIRKRREQSLSSLPAEDLTYDWGRESDVSSMGSPGRGVSFGRGAVVPGALSTRTADGRVGVSKEEEREDRRLSSKKRKVDKDQKQSERRKKILKRIFDANKELNKADKHDAKRHVDDEKKQNGYMLEAHHAIKKALIKRFTLRSTDSPAQSLHMDISKDVLSPALRIDSAILGNDENLDNIQLDDLHPMFMHPAAQKYFFIRESKKKSAQFDQELKHPAFFTADYERQPTRHSRTSMSTCRIIERSQAAGVAYREEHGTKRVKNIPPEEQIVGRVAKKNVVRFLLDVEYPPTPADTVARVTLLKIRVSGLTSLHLSEPNSPFVDVTCGPHRFSTEVHSFGGRSSTWDDLNWVFRLQKRDTLHAVVRSGSAVHSEICGNFEIGADDIAGLEIDDTGHASVRAPLLDGAEVVGEMVVEFMLELGEDYDWYVIQFRREENRKHKKLETQRQLSQRFSGHADHDKVDYPLPISITDVSLFDLKSAHVLTRNSPHVKLSCGHTTEVSSVKEGGGDSCKWDDMQWNVALHSETANLIFLIYSGSVCIGRYVINGTDLASLQRSSTNTVEVMGDIKQGQEFTGKISFTCTLDMSRRDLGSPARAPDEIDLHGDVAFPAIMHLHSLDLADLKRVSTFKQNSPQLFMTCGDWSRTTVPVPHSGAAASWWHLEWSFPLHAKLSIEIKVFSGFQVVGSLVIRASSLVKLRRTDGMQEIYGELNDGSALVGKVRIIASYSCEGQSYSVGKEFSALKGLAFKSPEIGGYGSLPLGRSTGSLGTGGGTAEVGVDMGAVIHHNSRTRAYPCRLTVTDIIANDMKSVHLLSQNSPTINFACGTSAVSTTEIPRAGSSAIWTGMNLVVNVSDKSAVRLAAWSKNACIGSNTMSSSALMDCAPDSTGHRDCFLTLADENGKITGKVKLTFYFETVEKVEVVGKAIDNSALVAGLTPPVLLTVYTVSVINLRPAHRFAQNSPIVKAAVGAWRGATSVQDYAGKNAKWEGVMWSVVVQEDASLRLSVQSGTIVLGEVKFHIDQLLRQRPSPAGLCELIGHLIDENDPTHDEGQVRMAYTYEAEPDTQIDSDSDEEAPTAPESGLPLRTSKTIRVVANVHLLSVSLSGLTAVHSIKANSPFLKIRCDEYRAITNTKFLTGKSAAWFDLSLRFGMTRQSSLLIDVVSDQTTVGVLSLSLADLQGEKDDFGNTIVRAAVHWEGVQRGQAVVKLNVDRIGRFAAHGLTHAKGAEPEEDSKFQSWDISRGPISIPFLLRIARVSILDFDPSVEKFFQSDVVLLEVRHDTWVKATPNTLRGAQVEWVDADWIFMVTNPKHPFLLSVMLNLQVVGTLEVLVSDIVNTAPSASGLVELSLHLFRGASSCAKVRLAVTLAPYITPAQELQRQAQIEQAPPAVLGYLRVKLLRVADLHQVYGLFLNSPKVSVTFGPWSSSTEVAMNAGSSHTWDQLSWGRIAMYERSTFTARVWSGNEVLGEFRITVMDLVGALEGQDSTVLLEGDVVDGAVCKGRFEMECLFVNEQNPDRAGSSALETPSRSASWQGTLSTLPDAQPDVAVLSASTPTPRLTEVTVLGISLYDLKPCSAVFRNSPQAKLNCDTWSNSTNVAKFTGSAANWILKGATWKLTMAAATFLKVSIFSGSSLLGSVVVSTRELLEIPKDSQGVTNVVRALERDLDVTGRLRLSVNVSFLQEMGDFYERREKGAMNFSVSNSVMRNGPVDAPHADIVLRSSHPLQLPLKVNIVRLTCLDVAAKRFIGARTISVQAESEEWRRDTPAKSSSGNHAEWDDLKWAVLMLKAPSTLSFCVKSGGSTVGRVTLTAQEMLSMPRTSQGFVEVFRNLRVKEGKIAGKLQICMLLSPFLNKQERQALSEIAERELEAQSASLLELAQMDVELISALDIPSIHGTVLLSLQAGDFSKRDLKTTNKAGVAVWGNLTWRMRLMERSNVVITVAANGEPIGKMLISAADVVATPVDDEGMAVVYGDLLDGIVYRGRISMTCRMRSGGTTIDSSGRVRTQIQDDVYEDYVVLHAISAKNMKPVHSVGKNSPMVKVELRGLRYQSASLPYAGSKAYWADLLWKLQTTPAGVVKVSLVSGSVLVGSAKISTKEVLEKLADSAEAVVTADLVKGEAYAGSVSLVLRRDKKPVLGLVGEELKDSVLFRLENDYDHSHLSPPSPSPSTSRGDESEWQGVGGALNVSSFRDNRQVTELDVQSLQSNSPSHTYTSRSLGSSGSDSARSMDSFDSFGSGSDSDASDTRSLGTSEQESYLLSLRDHSSRIGPYHPKESIQASSLEESYRSSASFSIQDSRPKSSRSDSGFSVGSETSDNSDDDGPSEQESYLQSLRDHSSKIGAFVHRPSAQDKSLHSSHHSSAGMGISSRPKASSLRSDSVSYAAAIAAIAEASSDTSTQQSEDVDTQGGRSSLPSGAPSHSPYPTPSLSGQEDSLAGSFESTVGSSYIERSAMEDFRDRSLLSADADTYSGAEDTHATSIGSASASRSTDFESASAVRTVDGSRESSIYQPSNSLESATYDASTFDSSNAPSSEFGTAKSLNLSLSQSQS